MINEFNRITIEPQIVDSVLSCINFYQHETDSLKKSGLFCATEYDGVQCWPPTLPSIIVQQRCPPECGSDQSKFSQRKCLPEGAWGVYESMGQNVSTNNEDCLAHFVKNFPEFSDLELLYTKRSIAEGSRILELIGLYLSCISLLISLIIFYRFRSLRNNRTRIHKNLFVAMLIHETSRLILYKTRRNDVGLIRTTYLGHGLITIVEYMRTVAFMWMFIEGLYLNTIVTTLIMQDGFPHRFYFILGWIGPVVLMIIWLTCMAMEYSRYDLNCWLDRNMISYFWILEGPRLAVIIINFIFLLNIIRVLVVKLRQTHTSDIEQTRKAVRAAIILVPLLGISDIFLITIDPKYLPIWGFATWAYTTKFLHSFQGFFVALIYCFLNGEVRSAIIKYLTVYMSLRDNDMNRRSSKNTASYLNTDQGSSLNSNAQQDDSQPHDRSLSSRNWFIRFWQKRLNSRHDENIAQESVTLNIHI